MPSPRRHLNALSLVVVLAAAALTVPAGAAAPAPRLVLPYDLEARGSLVYVADGLRHQILRYDLRAKRMTVVAGTGRPGTSGDGGPATRARLTEPTEIVLDRVGNLYFTDVNQGRVRRIDRRGTITTLARIPAAAGLGLYPDGRSLAVASIAGFVHRVDLATGVVERLAGDGTETTGGDGGPAVDAQLNGPHDATFDQRGDLLIAEFGGIRRIDTDTGLIATISTRPAFKLVPGPSGTLFLLDGDPSGGKVTQVDAGGRVLRVIGTGKLAKHTDRTPIGRVGFLPSDVEPVSGAILISQTQPVPAIRRLANGSATLTTLTR